MKAVAHSATNKHLLEWPVVSHTKWFRKQNRTDHINVLRQLLWKYVKNIKYRQLSLLPGEMVHETICISAVCPFFCCCSYVKTKEECF